MSFKFGSTSSWSVEGTGSTLQRPQLLMGEIVLTFAEAIPHGITKRNSNYETNLGDKNIISSKKGVQTVKGGVMGELKEDSSKEYSQKYKIGRTIEKLKYSTVPP